jgi:hypothetical protein
MGARSAGDADASDQETRGVPSSRLEKDDSTTEKLKERADLLERIAKAEE